MLHGPMGRFLDVAWYDGSFFGCCLVRFKHYGSALGVPLYYVLILLFLLPFGEIEDIMEGFWAAETITSLCAHPSGISYAPN